MTAPDLTIWPLDQLLWWYRTAESTNPLVAQIRAEIERRCAPAADVSALVEAGNAMREAGNAIDGFISGPLRSEPRADEARLVLSQGWFAKRRAWDAAISSSPPAPSADASAMIQVGNAMAEARLNQGRKK